MKKFWLVLCMTALLLLSGCGKSNLTDGEIRMLFEDLIEASHPVNVAYYGEGLPYTVDEAVLSYLLGADIDVDTAILSYMPVSEDAVYQSEAEIRAAAAAVYSPEICEYLYQSAFEGMSTDDSQTVSYARYIEQQEILTVRVDIADEALNVNRTYLYDEIEILIHEKNRIVASFPTLLDGETSVNVKVTVIKTADGWRLDSPTY